jgi:hypothetical protein
MTKNTASGGKNWQLFVCLFKKTLFLFSKEKSLNSPTNFILNSAAMEWDNEKSLVAKKE